MRINELPSATSVAQNDVLAIDTSNGTYQVPRSVLAPSPYVATIPTGQWSGSSGDYYITVTASNVTADSILIPHFDADSEANLQGPVWCVPAAGSFTIHTNTLPIGTVTILVQFIGIMGEAQYQVLADVYSKSQAVAKADIVDNLTSTATDKPLSANMGKALNDELTALFNPSAVIENRDLNDLKNNSDIGIYKVVGKGCSNLPLANTSGALIISKSANYIRQTYFGGYSPEVYTRVQYYADGAFRWTSWIQLTNA